MGEGTAPLAHFDAPVNLTGLQNQLIPRPPLSLLRQLQNPTALTPNQSLGPTLPPSLVKPPHPSRLPLAAQEESAPM